MSQESNPSKALIAFLEPGEGVVRSARANLRFPGHRFKQIGVATVTDQRFLYEDPGPSWAALLFGWIIMLVRGSRIHATALGDITAVTSEKKGWNHHLVHIDAHGERFGTLSVTDPEPWIEAFGKDVVGSGEG